MPENRTRFVCIGSTAKWCGVMHKTQAQADKCIGAIDRLKVPHDRRVYRVDLSATPSLIETGELPNGDTLTGPMFAFELAAVTPEVKE